MKRPISRITYAEATRVIHIATVHFQSDKWMHIQLRYLRKHLKDEFRVYACVPTPAEKYSDLYYFSSNYEPQFSLLEKLRRNFLISTHAEKLDYLVRSLCKDAQDQDLLIFMDGDAFPISDFLPFVRDKIQNHKLVAIRRDENNGDIQPHPSFCATTVGFWKHIKGDWRPGYCWRNHEGEVVTDIGANLLPKLRNSCDWYPLLRTNKSNPHPLWFGVYGDIIYHHGAGFRPPVSRFDFHKAGLYWPKVKWAFPLAWPVVSSRLANNVKHYMATPEYQATTHLMEEMFNKIRTDENFYLELTTEQ